MHKLILTSLSSALASVNALPSTLQKTLPNALKGQFKLAQGNTLGIDNVAIPLRTESAT